MRRWMQGTSRATRIAAAAVATAGLVGATASAATAAPDPVFGFQPDGFTVRALNVVSDGSGGWTRVPATQAGSHPDLLEVAFRLNTKPSGPGPRDPQIPVEALRDAQVELPPGIVGNPEATSKCSGVDFPNDCPERTVVGVHELTYIGSRGTTAPDAFSKVYNLVPPDGVAARFAFQIAGIAITIDMSVNSDGRYNVTSNIRSVSALLQATASRLTLFGVPNAMNGPASPEKVVGGYGAPNGGEQIPLLTLPNECGATLTSKIRARSWQNADVWASAEYTAPDAITGCERLSFSPTISARPETTHAASPSGFSVRVDVPQNTTPTGLATPNVRSVAMTLPEGVAISPAGARGLVGCTDEQAAVRSLADPSCPSASRIGSVRIETPVLAGPLQGDVFLGAPKSMQSQTGDMFRVFLVARGYGVTIKQEGRIVPDPRTGQLRATFDDAPQQPFSSLQVDFNGGPNAPLTTPSGCGTFTSQATITSWGGQTAQTRDQFSVDCRDGLGGFAPGLTAGTANVLAGASSPFNLTIARPDGQSALSTVRMTLPPGLLANLKGNLGTQVGTATAHAGLGPAPLGLPGKVYLEGAYGDAPFSLKVVVPAVAGPYDLGEVVVRQKLYVDPHDAHVTVVSDPLPTILEGVPVQLQRLDVSVDKPGFMINPTSCAAREIVGELGSVTGQTARIVNRFQVGGCADLGYRPSLDLRLSGAAKELRNGGHPQLDAKMTTRSGDANQRRVRVTLPLNLALDPDNAKALCEPAAAASNSCPAESIVGQASAQSILDVPLEGPVHFVRGERRTATGRVVATLPTLHVPLRGQGVMVILNATSDVVDRRLQTTFDGLPDAPISSFDLRLNGGANGILKVTNGDVCKSTSTPSVTQLLTGQNAKVLRATTPLGVGCRLGVARTQQDGGRLKVTVGGLKRGRLTIAGKGVQSNTRTIGAKTTVASLGVTLRPATRNALKAGRTVRLRLTVTNKPRSGKAAKVVRRVTLKPAKAKARAAAKAAARR